MTISDFKDFLFFKWLTGLDHYIPVIIQIEESRHTDPNDGTGVAHVSAMLKPRDDKNAFSFVSFQIPNYSILAICEQAVNPAQ